jgi:hypothetical protein
MSTLPPAILSSRVVHLTRAGNHWMSALPTRAV